MGGRAATIWAGVLAAAAAGRAADPDPPPGMPAVVAPQAPVPAAGPGPGSEPLGLPRPVDPPPVTAYQVPPDPYTGADPFAPPPPLDPGPILADGAQVTLPAAPRQAISFGPRYGVAPNVQYLPVGDTTRVVYTGGIIFNIVSRAADGRPQEAELAADSGVAWYKGAAKPAGGLPVEAGGQSEVELYLTGNVIIRTITTDAKGGRAVDQVLRAKALYYDVPRNRAIALAGDLETRLPGLPDSVHLRGEEIWQLGPNEWRAFGTEVAASKRPADPGLKFTARQSTLTREQRVRRNIFGVPYRDVRGRPDYGTEQVLTNDRLFLRVFDTPVFFLPRLRTDLNEPFGPLVGVGLGNDRVRGFQVYTTWDIYKLLGTRPPAGNRWVLFGDYLSERGPGVGTEYDYKGLDLFGTGRPETNLPFSGFVRLYGLRDEGEDVLGGDRFGSVPRPPDFRGRALWRHNQDLFESGTTYLRVLAQAQYESDRNFTEQFYKQEFDFGPNRETFAHLYGAAGNAGGLLWVEPKVQRPWQNETEWLPRADGYLIGESLFDLFSYTARASAGYARLRPASVEPLPVQPTDRRVDTGRFDLRQQLALPVDVGPLRVTPYGVVDLAYYTQDITRYNPVTARGDPFRGFRLLDRPGLALDPAGGDRARFYGAGGVTASATLSRLYPDARSELFNVRGLNHKVTPSVNYFAAYSDTPFTRLPQLDRMNDDTTDFSYRLSRPVGSETTGPARVALATEALFDPQRYALRRLGPAHDRPDSLDTVETVQVNVNQRLQTKRGFPGAEHTVDWVTFDVGISLFPDPDRDNFGEDWSFLEYGLVWHVGDRTSVSSAGWFDPFDLGARYFNLGFNFNRPDGTNFWLGYRHVDPVDSRAVTAGVSYALTPKYSVNANATYDFGINRALTNQLSVTRVGTDVTVLFGVSYNALVNNFGVQFAIVPNLAGIAPGRLSAAPLLGQR